MTPCERCSQAHFTANVRQQGSIVQPQDSYKHFRAYLKERNRTLKSLTVPDACDFMFDFYLTAPSEGTCQKMGDGITLASDIVQRKHRTPFELSIIRLFAVKEDAPAVGGSRLRLSLGYSWPAAVSWFARPDFGLPTVPGKYAWQATEAADLLNKFREHEVYKVLSQHSPRSVELRHEPIWSTFG
jgi:hypothetical protein